jgi:hypothetical protein
MYFLKRWQDENTRYKQRKSTTELMWIKLATCPTPTIPANGTTIPACQHLSHSKTTWLAWYPFCSMKHLHEGTHTVDAWCTFACMKIWKRTDEKGTKHNWVNGNRTSDLCHPCYPSPPTNICLARKMSGSPYSPSFLWNIFMREYILSPLDVFS